MMATSEEATAHHLSEGCVVGALTLLLGKIVGTIARERGHDLPEYVTFIVGEVRKIAWAEHRRRPWPIQ